jgi:hypothetical protein
MTSFAFILGVAPLVLASDAGASARVSIGVTVFTGMIASTCLAVLFVPLFFVMGSALRGVAQSPKRSLSGRYTGRVDFSPGGAISRALPPLGDDSVGEVLLTTH